MHSSLGVSELTPFGQSYAGLESLSVYRASVVQRMRTRAQYVASMIICWCSTGSAVVASSSRNRANYLQNNGDYIAPSRNGDTTGGLDRVGAAARA
jgi:hypothetical protein